MPAKNSDMRGIDPRPIAPLSMPHYGFQADVVTPHFRTASAAVGRVDLSGMRLKLSERDSR